LRPDKSLPHARIALALLAAALLVGMLVFAPSALADAVSPESGGSPQAGDIDTLYKITLGIAILIFVIVEGTLIWSLVRYRFRRGGPAPEQIRGNTPLEIGWTVGAALILVVLTVITFMYLGDIENPERTSADGLQFATVDQPAPPGDKALEIDVNGQQYLWRYDYPGDPRTFSYHELVVPVNTTVVLKITGSDVIHSWWVPKLGGKMDGVPGHTNETWFKISKPGNYEGVCAELCGEGHAEMRTRVRALPVAEYERWREGQAAGIARSQEILPAQRVARESGEQTPARPSETDTSEEQQ
jgi:cytochrome c oxidase subunit II